MSQGKTSPELEHEQRRAGANDGRTSAAVEQFHSIAEGSGCTNRSVNSATLAGRELQHRTIRGASARSTSVVDGLTPFGSTRGPGPCAAGAGDEESPLLAVHSLKTASFSPGSTSWWLHCATSFVRIICGSVIGITTAGCHIQFSRSTRWDLTDAPLASRRFARRLLSLHSGVAIITSICLLACGILGAVFTLGLRSSPEDLKTRRRYLWETVAVRCAFIVAAPYLLLVAAVITSTRNAFCAADPLVQNVDGICLSVNWLWGSVVAASVVVVATLCCIPISSGRFFRTFNLIIGFRYIVTAITLALTTTAHLYMRFLRLGQPDFDNLVHEAVLQFQIAQQVVEARGYFSVGLGAVSCIFGFSAGYLRSKTWVAFDTAVLFIMTWFQVTFCIGFMWTIGVLTFFRNYEAIYGMQNDVADLMGKRFLQVVIILLMTSIGVTTAGTVVQSSFNLFGFTSSPLCPREWTVKDRLLQYARKRRNSY